MLEVRDLYKVYKPKRGVAVTAINHVSLKFPDRGMVFLLGKSGSGKSTMLNLLGGLDSYDGGEIIIKGVSSKDFKQQHFDSYRNTYVGFIFQEYNILDEFTVGANIALALELQGRKATDELINQILEEVDLVGYGNRKPNELSGGQKQRVAIARALIKNPEIIMADEPTGALDSATGRQVFDTLKKLSKDKLIIIVSHDREFSEQYADRIIELADGSVISDVELAGEIAEDGSVQAVEEVAKNVTTLTDAEGNEIPVSEALTLEGNNIVIEAGYHLTEDDRKAINAYMDSLEKNESLILSKKVHRYKNVHFVATDESKIKQQDGHDFKLIKSKLPMKNAFRIGASGLGYKKFRLVMTILLSCVAFTLFGLADTFGAFNYKATCAESLVDSDINYVSLNKGIKYVYGEGENDWYWSYDDSILTQEDVEKIENDLGIQMTGVFTPREASLELRNYNDEIELYEGYYSSYMTSFSGYAEVTDANVTNLGCKVVAGKLPQNKTEIAISAYAWETYHKAYYSKDGKVFSEIKTYEDMVNREVQIDGSTYTIVGIVDTGLDFTRYACLNESAEGISTAQQIINFALQNELSYALRYSLTGTVMVCEGFVQDCVKEQPDLRNIRSGYLSMYSSDGYVHVQYMGSLAEAKAKNVEIEWVDEERTTLGENEWIVSSACLDIYRDGEIEIGAFLKDATFDLSGRIGNQRIDVSGIKIVGYFDGYAEENGAWRYACIANERAMTDYGSEATGTYQFVVGAMPQGQMAIRQVIDYTQTPLEDGTVIYSMQNAVTYELDAVATILKAVAKVFLFIGIGFAVFASLMLANFIGTSINYKKQEIGILRAIGSRGNDVFRIFFSESFIIAMINFVISCIGVFAITRLVNYIIRWDAGILITVLHFSIRQVGLLLVVSVAVAVIASFIPVKRIASKKPIDAIRNR